MFNLKKVAAVTLGSFAGALVFVSAARADIPAAVGTAFTGVLTDATSLQSTMIPIVVGVMSLGIIISLIKRFGSKI